jgi:hypothetical protein
MSVLLLSVSNIPTESTNSAILRPGFSLIVSIKSLTKNFTASLAGVLEARKIFSLQDPVKKYLHDFNLANKELEEIFGN